MTTQTMFDIAPDAPTLSERLRDTPLDPVRGRAREYRAIFAITFLVLVPGFALARLVAPRRAPALGRRSVIQEAKCAASSALAYAYRH